MQGAADPRFANVLRIFAGLFPGRRFGGGALVVYIDGKPVADVWTDSPIGLPSPPRGVTVP